MARKKYPAAPAIRKSGRPAASASVSLKGMTPASPSLLSAAGKQDGADSARGLVRGSRFSDSYMMATNGGSTYEDVLRPQKADHPPPALPPPPRPSRNPSGLHNVFGTDDRKLIDDTSRVPARSVGLLKITPEHGGARYGTAWLIGPRTLATAAHNLIHPEAGRTISLEVGMAYDGASARGGWHRIVDNAFSRAWEENPSEDNPNDFAVLKIENADIGNKLGWFGFADYEDGKFDNLLVNIFGYPMDVSRKFHLFGAAGRVVNLDRDRIFYDCDAGGGMSGGPLIARFGEQRIAVGVHIAGGADSNAATRIVGPVFEFFRERQTW